MDILDKCQQLDDIISYFQENEQIYKIKIPKITILKEGIVIKIDSKLSYERMLKIYTDAKREYLHNFFEFPKMIWSGKSLVVYSQERVKPVSQMEEFYSICQSFSAEEFLSKEYPKLFDFCKNSLIQDLAYWNMGFNGNRELKIFDYDY